MSENASLSPAPRPSPCEILWRISAPLCLFCAVLAGLLTLSWTLLLPRYTQIEVGGVLREAREIRQYRDSLTAQVTAREEERKQAVLAVNDPRFEALKKNRRSQVPLDTLRRLLTEHAKSVTGKDNAILWTAFTYEPKKNALVIQGDVRNSGTASMTVLAEFAQSLKTLPFVSATTTPAFTREEDPAIGFHSPFTITLTIKP